MKYAHNFCGLICSKVFSVTTMVFSKQTKFENENLLKFLFFEVFKVTLSKFEFSLF